MSIYLKNFLRFLLLIGLQVLILNKIPLRWWTNPSGFPAFIPFIYPLFILLLPIQTPMWFVLISSFVLGLTVDGFMNTGGIHAAACVLMAFSRMGVLKFLLPKKINEFLNTSPSVKTMNWTPFLTYSSILLLIHHATYFLIEIWGIGSPIYLLIKIGASLVTSMLFVIIYALLFGNSIDNGASITEYN